MNKYDFIADLLEKEKFDSSQKERVFKLIVNELKTDGKNKPPKSFRTTQKKY